MLLARAPPHPQAAHKELLESTLSKCPTLKSLTPHEMAQLTEAMETVVFPPGSCLSRRGEAMDSLHVLLAGEVRG